MGKDLYTEILNTSKPNHYQLLGLKLFERDAQKIHKASLRQMKKLKAWDLHEDEDTLINVKQIRVQLGYAIAELEDPEKKGEYDIILAKELGIPLPGLLSNKEPAQKLDNTGSKIIHFAGGLLLGIVGIAISLIILLPALNSAKNKAKTSDKKTKIEADHLSTVIATRNKEITKLKKKVDATETAKEKQLLEEAEKKEKKRLAAKNETERENTRNIRREKVLEDQKKRVVEAQVRFEVEQAMSLILKNQFTKAFYVLRNALKKYPDNQQISELYTRMYLQAISSVSEEKLINIRNIDGIPYLYLDNVPKKYHPNVQIYNGHAYCLISIWETWPSAKKSCEKMKGHLVTISNVLENDFIKKLVDDNRYVWLGASKSKEGKWQWVTGEKWNFPDWQSETPYNDYRKSDNLTMHRTSYYPIHYAWKNKRGNSNQFPFICEWDKAWTKLTFKPLVIEKLYKKKAIDAKKFSDIGNKTKALTLLRDIIKKIPMDHNAWNTMKKLEPDFITGLINETCSDFKRKDKKK